MIPLLLSILILFLALLLLITLVNCLWGPMLAKAPAADGHTPLVSILVPARNEERSLPDCLASLGAQEYPGMEVLVLNDNSSDGTAAVVKKFALTDSRISLLEGGPLPPGWTGKNWACHQLSKAARGEILIFTDADNWYHPAAVQKTIAWMFYYNLGLLSAFPQQLTRSLAERLAVPMLELFLYSTLPLWLTYTSRFPSLAAANGQWIAFSRSAYKRLGGHAALRDQIVEDVEFSRRAKRKAISMLTLAGTGVIFGRMYHSAAEVWEGFSKNLFGLTGYNSALFIVVLLGFLLVSLFPLVLLFVPAYSLAAAVAVGELTLIRLLLSWRYRHPPVVGTVLHSVGALYLAAIGINSFRSIRRGTVRWKGRSISTFSSSG